ncbi:phenazine biosynthesis protein phzE [Amycolatopsis xylanica]|uniref:anthranilate synthase n=1 Tax=Amycolatopsis xylanica TaxID=589385 RepID=A0A1H3P472_9PSEU|nr:anthranilate synthase family protein [Amycolatopsis xylanica]SDY95851.1 phenazine biosynthesis protein phzE [Amycolatopsis xylanica]
MNLFDTILADNPPAFALLHRPESTGTGKLEIIVGEVSTPDTLAELPLTDVRGHQVLTIVPYRQLAERGFEAPDDGEPLIALSVESQAVVSVGEALWRLPDVPISLESGRFDVDDETYAETVRRVIADEIGTGEGANFVIKRSYLAEISDYTVHSALSFFKRLLQKEQGAYWTYLVHTGDRTFVGASPERHLSLDHGTAVMNPVSGTYRYGENGASLAGVLDFLADRKEADELYMVVDEELKMMSRVCDGGGRVLGPFLKEMAKVAHTEYLIEGETSRDPREILRETLFAPTVTGSPLESACRVINRYEPQGRGYYSGVVALIGRDADGGHALDSSIVIRTADISATGAVKISVGATLVRHSDPMSEVAETRAKAAGLLAALRTEGPVRYADDPRVRAMLAERNKSISGFWLGKQRSSDELSGRVLVVDAEDTFTSMIEQQLRSLGLDVDVRRFDTEFDFDAYDLVVLGPGPGDPRHTDHPKITRLHDAVRTLLQDRKPFLAVCLSHQVLSLQLGLPIARRAEPNQGVQKEIDLFGKREKVGFYNTFAAESHAGAFALPGLGWVEVSRDAATGEVHALRGRDFASLQFHPESLLTADGVRILRDRVSALLERAVTPGLAVAA